MCTSMAVEAMKMPERPPITKQKTKATALSMAAVKRMLPPQSVASQLKVLIADGTAMNMVLMANVVPSVGFIPLWNMWCAQTMNPRNAMPASAYTIGRYPKIGLRALVAMMSDTMPIAGRIMMYTAGC